MTNRITKADLENLCDRINEAAGTPLTPYKRDTKRCTPNAGNYHLAGAYGGWKLEQMSSTEGCTGTSCVTTSGFTTKRELYAEMNAFLNGMNASKGN